MDSVRTLTPGVRPVVVGIQGRPFVRVGRDGVVPGEPVDFDLLDILQWVAENEDKVRAMYAEARS